MVQLETNRFIIRDHITEDSLPMHRLLSDKKAMHYLPELQTETLEESKRNLSVAMLEAAAEERTKYFFAITEKESGEYIGEIGFTVTEYCSEGKIVNLGYFILPAFWRKGVVTEAAKAVVDFAFEAADAIKIETGCAKENIGSEGVMKKLEMSKEAELKKYTLIDGKLYDRLEYRMLKEEWMQKKSTKANNEG